jgi:uncharacterized membrane protein YiaA
MAKKGKMTFRIKSIDVKKAMVSGAVFWGVMGFVVGLICAIPTLMSEPGNSISVIILAPIAASVLGAVACGIITTAKNFALHVSKGFDVEVEM